MNKKEIRYLEKMGPYTYENKNKQFIEKHKDLVAPFREFEQSGIPVKDYVEAVCLTLSHIDTSLKNKIALANVIGPKTGKYIEQHLDEIETVI